MSDLFSNAKVQKAPDAKTSASKKNDKSSFQVGETTLDAYVGLVTLKKMIEAHMNDFDAEVKREAMGIYSDMGIDTGKVPETFCGETPNTRVTNVFQKRSSTSELSPEQIELLEMYNIPMDEKTKSEAIEECYKINPKLFENPKLMKAFSDALVKAKMTEIDGESILIKQEGRDAVKAKIASENSIPTIFEKAKKGEIKRSMVIMLLSAVCTQVLKNGEILDSAHVRDSDGNFNPMSTISEFFQKAMIDLFPKNDKKPAKKK